MNVDYNSIMRKNERILARKWRVGTQLEAFGLTQKPEGVSLYVPLDAQPLSYKYEVSLNNERVDLVHEATDMEFAGWVYHMLKKQPLSAREAIIRALTQPLSNKEPTVSDENEICALMYNGKGVSSTS
jgi:hypothetical protein